MKITLNLGCRGRKYDNFTMCNGIINEILDITPQTQKNVELSDYLDKVYQLFDKPLNNNIHTALYNIQEKFSEKGKPIFNSERYKKLEEFCVLHAKCGLFLRLRLEDGE